MGCVVLIYIIILTIDLIVGSAMIAWKCKLINDEEECNLAIGGTIGSVILWFILLLIFPTCMVRVDLYEQRKWLKTTFQNIYTKLVPEKSSHLQSNIQTAFTSHSLISEKKALVIGGNTNLILKGEDRISSVYIPMMPEREIFLSNDTQVPNG